MSAPFVRAARVYDRTVHWRETTYQGNALHQTSLLQMGAAPHTLCDNCHEEVQLSAPHFSALNLYLNIAVNGTDIKAVQVQSTDECTSGT